MNVADLAYSIGVVHLERREALAFAFIDETLGTLAGVAVSFGGCVTSEAAGVRAI